MRILILGAGVIGSVYAAKLLQAGHEVVLLARGRRLTDLRTGGLVLQDAGSGERTVLPVRCVSEVGAGDRFDLVVVPVRAEQLLGTLPLLAAMTDGSDVLFFGNPADHRAALVAGLGSRALFGFPAAGGTRDGPVVRYVLISQQKTMLGEPDGSPTVRVRRLQRVLSGAGFATTISADIGGWLLGHAAFVVPIAFALYRMGGDATHLAADHAVLRLMARMRPASFTVSSRGTPAFSAPHRSSWSWMVMVISSGSAACVPHPCTGRERGRAEKEISEILSSRPRGVR